MRHIGNVHTYTLQCGLRINEYVEVGLLIIWLWLWLTFTLLLLSVIGRVLQVIFLVVMPRWYKTKRINVLLCHKYNHDDPNMQGFVELWMKPDGALLLELLEYNVSMNAACGVVKAAWLQYQAKRCDVTQPDDNMAQAGGGMDPLIPATARGDTVPLVQRKP